MAALILPPYLCRCSDLDVGRLDQPILPARVDDGDPDEESIPCREALQIQVGALDGDPKREVLSGLKRKEIQGNSELANSGESGPCARGLDIVGAKREVQGLGGILSAKMDLEGQLVGKIGAGIKAEKEFVAGEAKIGSFQRAKILVHGALAAGDEDLTGPEPAEEVVDLTIDDRGDIAPWQADASLLIDCGQALGVDGVAKLLGRSLIKGAPDLRDEGAKESVELVVLFGAKIVAIPPEPVGALRDMEGFLSLVEAGLFRVGLAALF